MSHVKLYAKFNETPALGFAFTQPKTLGFKEVLEITPEPPLLSPQAQDFVDNMPNPMLPDEQA